MHQDYSSSPNPRIWSLNKCLWPCQCGWCVSFPWVLCCFSGPRRKRCQKAPQNPTRRQPGDLALKGKWPLWWLCFAGKTPVLIFWSSVYTEVESGSWGPYSNRDEPACLSLLDFLHVIQYETRSKQGKTSHLSPISVLNVPGGMQQLFTVQVDGCEIAWSLLVGFPQPRTSGLFTHNKPALPLICTHSQTFLQWLFLHFSAFLNAAKIRFRVIALQHHSSYSTFSLLRITKPSDFCKMEIANIGLRWTTVRETRLLGLSLGLTMERRNRLKVSVSFMFIEDFRVTLTLKALVLTAGFFELSKHGSFLPLQYAASIPLGCFLRSFEALWLWKIDQNYLKLCLRVTVKFTCWLQCYFLLPVVTKTFWKGITGVSQSGRELLCSLALGSRASHCRHVGDVALHNAFLVFFIPLHHVPLGRVPTEPWVLAVLCIAPSTTGQQLKSHCEMCS